METVEDLKSAAIPALLGALVTLGSYHIYSTNEGIKENNQEVSKELKANAVAIGELAKAVAQREIADVNHSYRLDQHRDAIVKIRDTQGQVVADVQVLKSQIKSKNQ